VLGRDFVRPLEDDWRDTLDDVARSRGWPTSREVAKLASRVAALSSSYNDASKARATARDAGPARLAFSFVRDVPKTAGAVRELVAVGALRLGTRLSVLDLGAGMGASTWGLVRALEAAGEAGTIDVTWVDADGLALEVAMAIARARAGRGRVELRATAMQRSAGPLPGARRFDVVLAGQVLSELDVGLADGARTEKHAALLASWLDWLEPGGSLVLVEPALRDRTRHLHRLHDAMLAAGATVFAPCLHASTCPALARDGDWCHEDLAVDLPAWLVPVARAAGLRHEGLTFSYLVLRRDGRRLSDAVSARQDGSSLRMVSGPMPSKGKLEAFLCGALPSPTGPVVSRARVTRLDRDASPANTAWAEATRGDVVLLEPAPPLDRPRIERATRVALSGVTKTR
jgi:ribosomal protein RSM22 (predicted rRNA methylase)